MTLTTTPQEIVGSNVGIIIFPATFMYGFGSVQPTTAYGKNEEVQNDPFEYGGAYGNIWVWKETENENSTIEYNIRT